MIDIFKPLIEEYTCELFTPYTSGAVRKDLLVFVLAEVFLDPLGKFFEVCDIRPDGSSKVPQVILITVSAVEDDHIFLLHHIVPLFWFQIRAHKILRIHIVLREKSDDAVS